jgi:hypothetical protein
METPASVPPVFFAVRVDWPIGRVATKQQNKKRCAEV